MTNEFFIFKRKYSRRHDKGTKHKVLKHSTFDNRPTVLIEGGLEFYDDGYFGTIVKCTNYKSARGNIPKENK